MTLKLNGETDGSVSIDAPADTSPSGSDITLTLPTTVGSANQFVKNGGTAGELEYSSMVETSTDDVQARRDRSNTAGDVALSVQPSDSSIHYGLRIDAANNNLNLDRASGTATNLLAIDSSGMVDVKSGDLRVTGGEGVSASLYLIADEGDDNGDGWRINSNQDDNDLTISHNSSGSYADQVSIKSTGRVGVNITAPASRLHVSENSTTLPGMFIDTPSGSYAADVQFLRCGRGNNSGYTFLVCQSAYTGSTDNEFILRGDGNAFADDSWNGGGADYAEYFEWSDGNTEAEDRRGISVVLDGDKIREAVTGEEPIGVISGNPSVVGDADIERWKHKYLRDDFGTYIRDEEGDRQLNPDYDPDTEYVSRENRAEWDTVGLMGKLRIRKGQVTGARWIKMRDVSDTVEEWLVR